MIPETLSLRLSKKEVQEFIQANENADERKLVLRSKVIHGIPAGVVADQIAARRKAKIKLPAWHRAPGIVYPPSINLEQCSSQSTAQFKAGLVSSSLQPMKVMAGADVSAGFGVDAFYLSRISRDFDCVEPDAGLLEMAKHNHAILGAANVHYHPDTAEAFVRSSNKKLDFVYVDPSRRSKSGKVFKLADCEPDVRKLVPAIFDRTDLLLIKASPLLDLRQGWKELGPVEKIVVVAVENECREILFLCRPWAVSEPVIRCVNLTLGLEREATREFTFTFSQEQRTSSFFSEPLPFLYEPDADILKAGAFKLVGNEYGLSKVHVSTHLYTSDKLVENFPGRIFRIENLKPYPSKRSLFDGGKVNILTRNYPLTPEQLKKKLKLRDGGDKYLIGFSGLKQKFLVTAIRLK